MKVGVQEGLALRREGLTICALVEATEVSVPLRDEDLSSLFISGKRSKMAGPTNGKTTGAA